MCELTRNPRCFTPTYDLSPWTVELLVDAYDSRWPEGPYEMPSSCEGCCATGEELLFRGHGGAWLCGACAAACEYCDQRPAIVSARRGADDPSAPLQVDHVCESCLTEHWDPAEMVRGAYLCPDCDIYHVREEDCCACHGDGWFDRDEETEYGAVAVARHCDCPAGHRLCEEDEREHSWMIPHVQRAQAARRRGDHDEAECIKHDVLRYDSPFDPINRGA